MKQRLTIAALGLLLAACSTVLTRPAPAPTPAALPNPAAVYCQAQGYRSEIRTAADGSQVGYCVFPDGSECDEWAYFRGECGAVPASAPTGIPTALPIDPADRGPGWWTYTHAVYGFSIQLPEDWVVEEITTFDPLMSGHSLYLRPEATADRQLIRMTFRQPGDETRLWPTGVGQGEFIQQGTLEIAGQPASRMLLVCPNGDVTAIWYHGTETGQTNMVRGGLEFGFIYSAGGHCEPGLSLGGKVQRWGELIIASLTVP